MTTYNPTPGGPRPGRQKCGKSRTLRLTPQAEAAVRARRMGWRGDEAALEYVQVPVTAADTVTVPAAWLAAWRAGQDDDGREVAP